MTLGWIAKSVRSSVADLMGGGALGKYAVVGGAEIDMQQWRRHHEQDGNHRQRGDERAGA